MLSPPHLLMPAAAHDAWHQNRVQSSVEVGLVVAPLRGSNLK